MADFIAKGHVQIRGHGGFYFRMTIKQKTQNRRIILIFTHIIIFNYIYACFSTNIVKAVKLSFL